MNIETVNELIASLESAGELSIREQKFLKLAKAFKQLAEENAALKSSRAILAENALETCNEVYTAGFRNTALHDGLMESTGNRNKYPNPIRTLVDEAKRNIETPATDRIVAGIKAEGAEACVRALVTSDDDDFTDAPNICAMVAYQLRDGGNGE
ncbi:hypothetical protein VAJ15_09645 [Klebsiella pneumoniae]|nr:MULTISPECIES: hypothetical protein [Klebsiella]AMA31616.1 hypothetical protein RJF9_19685 [Klebsiella pneumoniae subsp. pneumoniae]AOE32632.1 hypothetical protein BCV49_20805 [Klebsiella pneumoniae]AUB46687.1 hypothetical protein SGH10_001299 [Klebsiella pneumoniae]AUN58529.1 hypothetical protein C0076_20615 [Klebsiella pneumoniae]AUN69135.1 hypothetical protein C0066_20015 [Klebsiella pneumoniae]